MRETTKLLMSGMYVVSLLLLLGFGRSVRHGLRHGSRKEILRQSKLKRRRKTEVRQFALFDPHSFSCYTTIIVKVDKVNMMHLQHNDVNDDDDACNFGSHSRGIHR